LFFPKTHCCALLHCHRPSVPFTSCPPSRSRWREADCYLFSPLESRTCPREAQLARSFPFIGPSLRVCPRCPVYFFFSFYPVVLTAVFFYPLVRFSGSASHRPLVTSSMHRIWLLLHSLFSPPLLGARCSQDGVSLIYSHL